MIWRPGRGGIARRKNNSMVEISNNEYQGLQQKLEQIKESEERLKIIFELAPDAYYLNSLHGVFIDGNKAAEELTGYTRQELIGKNFLQLSLLSAEQIPRAAASLAQNARGKATGPDGFILTRKDGTRVDVEIHTHPVKIKGQSLVLGIARNISERKQARDALKDSEKKFRMIFETVDEGILLLDRHGTILDVNPKLLTLAGFNHAEIAGKNITQVLPLINIDIPPVLAAFKNVFLSGKPAWASEWSFHDKTGKKIFVLARPSIIKKHGKFTGLLVVLEDISKHKEAEARLKEQMAELEQFYKAAIGRELKMAEMEEEIKELKQQIKTTK
jgi:PAS domain S-box-containing protein